MDDAKPRPTDLAKQLEVSVPYASQLLSGTRVPSMQLAVRILDKTGLKLGPLKDATPAQIRTVRQMVAAEVAAKTAA